MTDVNIGLLAALAKKAFSEMTNGQEYMLSDVNSRLQAAYNQFPEDAVIRSVAFAIEKRAEKATSGATISQKDISELYNSSVRLSSSSKFREVLGDMLNTKQAQTADHSDFINAQRGDDKSIDMNSLSDAGLVESFSGLMNSKVNDASTSHMKDVAASYVSENLRLLGFNPKISFVAKENGYLVYSAGFDTNNGIVRVAVPVEIKGNKVSFPEVFVSGGEIKQLTRANLDAVLPQGNASEVNSFNRLDNNSLQIDEKVAMPFELAHLTADFESKVVEAASKFGKDTVFNGKTVVAYELNSAGFKNAQVRYAAENDEAIVYVATLNTANGPVDIEVPTEIRKLNNNKFITLAPTIFTFAGKIDIFTKEALQTLVLTASSRSSIKPKHATAHTYMNLADLKEEILRAVSANDHISAETVLNHIQDNYSENDYKNAFADYQHILTVKAVSEAQPANRKCSMEIKAGKTSVFPVCGHYHVPMDKIIVNASGECQLKTSIERERLNPVDQTGALMSSSKIFLT